MQTLPDPPARCHALLRNFLTRKSGLIMNDGKALLATKTTEVVTTDPGDDNDRISEAVEGLVSRWRLSAFKVSRALADAELWVIDMDDRTRRLRPGATCTTAPTRRRPWW